MIQFQVVSILGEDIEPDEESDSEEEDTNIPKYRITIFG